MLPPLIKRARRSSPKRHGERGVTMALVAVSMVAIISFAALAIDLGTLYEAKAEAQRSADAAALAAARIISISGITGDATNGALDLTWNTICGGTSSVATVAAVNVAQQNLIGGAQASKVYVYYGTSAGAGSCASPGTNSCTGAGVGFGVNPVVSVCVQQAKLPTFFSRVFSLITNGTTSNSGVSATAVAEVFNPSSSGVLNGNMVPVQPRCVKPWLIPNSDPGNSGFPFVSAASGAIGDPGVNPLNGGGIGKGVIGESFLIGADCVLGKPDCNPISGDMYHNPPLWNDPTYPQTNVLEYVPAQVTGTPVAVPSCSAATGFQPAIAGCDQSTVYACGVSQGTAVNLLNENPGGTTGDTYVATQCLINNGPNPGGYDSLVTGVPGPGVFPFLIQAGVDNPLVKAHLVHNNDYISTSNSIVTLPIFDTSSGGPINPQVTVVGFLQVFINSFDNSPNANMNVTVLNVSGCSNNATNPPVQGTSPVPVRLITPP